MTEQKQFQGTQIGISGRPIFCYINTVTIQQYTWNILQEFIF